MAQPYSISFGPWVPDGGDVVIGMPYQYSPTAIPLADCLNVYWSDQGYRTVKALAATGTPISAQALGAFVGIAANDTQTISGTSTDLYRWTGTGWVNASKSVGAYAGTTAWSFVQYGGCIVGANGVTVLQDMTVGGSSFADIAGSPIGTALGVIGQFLLVGNLTSPSLVPWRVQWNGIGDPTNWPTPLTDAAIAAQSSYEDLTQSFGQVQFIAGGPLQGIIFQQLGITLANYVGGDVVFQFSPFDRKRGLLVPNAAVQVGSMTHFLSGSGFYMTNGSEVIPTGSATDGSVGLDRWFWANVNQAALPTISAAWDDTLKCVVFAIPTGSNTLPDTLLFLNPADRRWTRAQVATELLFTSISEDSVWPAVSHNLSAFDQTHHLASLGGAGLAGHVETYDGAFLDGRVRDVVEAQPQILCTDTPSMTIGYRESLQDSVTYSSPSNPDAFSRRCTWDPPPAGRYIRTRVNSGAASALNGAAIYTEMGGV